MRLSEFLLRNKLWAIQWLLRSRHRHPLQGNVGNGMASQAAYITVFDRRILYDTPHVGKVTGQLTNLLYSRFQRSDHVKICL